MSNPWEWGEDDHLERYGEPFMWPECSCGCNRYERGFYDTAMRDTNKKFIATFDPEHVALMEAVCDVARECSGDAAGILSTALSDLDAYRKERWSSGQ